MKKKWIISIPDDKDIIKLALRVQAKNWGVMQKVLKNYYINQLKENKYVIKK